MAFTEEQIERYSRHILLPEVGGKGQKRIAESKVLIIGAGGLGSPAALYLAAAGVGTIGIIDGDKVDRSNLHRQVIHSTPDMGTSKVLSAKAKMEAINSNVRVATVEERLSAANARALFDEYDIILDGTDNFPAKFLINDAAVMSGKPLIHGGILRFDGQIFTILPKKSACYRCIFKEPPPPGAVPSCQEAGVLGVLAGVIGTLQATEALKLILNIGEPLTDRILTYEAKTTAFREIRIRRNPRCPVCGDHPSITELIEYDQKVCEI